MTSDARGRGRALELELLARVALWGRPVPLATVFDCAADLVPGWALEACDRLVIAGRLRELRAGKWKWWNPAPV
jgi:hypothetical protein